MSLQRAQNIYSFNRVWCSVSTLLAAIHCDTSRIVLSLVLWPTQIRKIILISKFFTLHSAQLRGAGKIK